MMEIDDLMKKKTILLIKISDHFNFANTTGIMRGRPLKIFE